jgi:hypothetical protein
MTAQRSLTSNLALATLWSFWCAVAVAALAVLVALSANGGEATAAAAELKIADLDCNASPEVIEIENEGPDAQDLAGWKLLSDPIASESFDLTELGSLPANSSVFIEAGPGAQAAFTWSTAQVFRNNDATDFARLIDDTGQTRAETACAAQATGTASPTPTRSAAPTPTVTSAPAVNVPNGGGPPGDVSHLPPSPLVAIVAGGSLLGVAAMAFSAAWLGTATRARRRRESPLLETTSVALPTLPASVRRVSRAAQDGSRPLLLVMAVAIIAAIAVVMFAQPASSQRK